MSDRDVRQYADDLPVFEFPDVAYTAPPPLDQARVAIVTTAGLRTDGSGDGNLLWARGDEGFTVLPAGARDIRMAHASQNFDRSGFMADLNVVYPADRLAELAAAGTIGSVAPRNLSFMGAQADHRLSTIRLDTGPEAASLLRHDGVDVVVLTPV